MVISAPSRALGQEAAEVPSGAPQILLDDAFDDAVSRSEQAIGDATADATANPNPDPNTSSTDNQETDDADNKSVAPVVSDDSRNVTTGELETIDPAAIGTLGPAEGGFSTELWRGSSRSLVERLLPRLPVATKSFAMQDLARRLMLTRTAVPEGPATVPSLLGLRVERLMAAGRASDVVDLVGRSAIPSDVPIISRARADALFLVEDSASACDLTEIMIVESDDPYWLKAATLCRAERGDKAGAGLAVELLHEQGSVEPVFVELAARLLAPKKDSNATVDKLTPLRLEMMRATGQTLSSDLLEAAGPAIQASLSRDQGLELDRRLELAQLAEAIGALSGPDLGKIYSSVAFPPDDVLGAVDAAKSAPGPRANARLYQLASGNYPDEERFAALQTLWRQGSKAETLGSVAAATLTIAQSITPDQSLSWLAPDIVRALLAAGDITGAGRWRAMLSEDASAQLWPFLVFADPGAAEADPEQGIDAWQRTLSDLTAEQKAIRSAVVFALIEASGQTIPDHRWSSALGTSVDLPGRGDIAAVRLMNRASSASRLGETVIYALLALGPQGPEKSHPDLIVQIYQALVRVGLTDDARRIVIEALLGRNL